MSKLQDCKKETYKYCVEYEKDFFKYKICRKVIQPDKHCDIYNKKLQELDISNNIIKPLCVPKSLSNNTI
jgi:hypothetical protein